MKRLALFGFILLNQFLWFHCRPASLDNVCDSKSKSFFPQLILSTSGESLFCSRQVFRDGNPYAFQDFTFYKNVPIQVRPISGSLSNIQLSPSPPEGIFVNLETGTISGTPTNLSPRTYHRVLRKGAFIGTVSIEVRDFTPSFVYGQFGNLNCGVSNNQGGCVNGIPFSASNLSSPLTVTSDRNGGVYVSTGSRVLYYPKAESVATRVYGQHGLFNCNITNANSDLSCSSSSLSEKTLHTARGIFLTPSQNVFIADSTNHRVLVYSNESTDANRVIGAINFSVAGGGAASQSTFSNPYEMAYDNVGGFFLSDAGSNRVLYFPIDSFSASEVWGQPNFINNGSSQGTGGLNIPTSMIVDRQGGLYIADSGNNRVLYYPNGTKSATRVYGQLDFASSAPPGSASVNRLNYPLSVALDQSDNLYVADYNYNRVMIFPSTENTAGTNAIAVIGQSGSFTCGIENNDGTCNTGSASAGNLYRPSGVHIDQEGRLYVSDTSNNRVLRY
ncbi:NHL repeat-containing protein [Leptospira jelokensis]|uniref:NHL repeat protein n=1 Tax=Leptospira jelokensis TaxID=2484931 RepID=A0A4Z1A4E0_9LEPT|nr:NHL repeat-containing protein [Leptospira jelokensis]TGL72237.1 hypothetical protein EHQ62_05245 [Leptospira jelokensis]TGM00173.1 hypothetical protein EHQ79_14105 [Leptospira jelokensis]